MRHIVTAVMVAAMGAATMAGVAEARGKSKKSIVLEEIGTGLSGLLGAEIAAYDERSERLFVVEPDAPGNGRVAIVDLSDPAAPTVIGTIATTGEPNSVAVRKGGVVAVAEAISDDDGNQSPGLLNLYNVDGHLLTSCTVGALPDMVTFTPNRRYALVANEGEPNDEYTFDPEGTVSVIDVNRALRRGCDAHGVIRTADFKRFNHIEKKLRDAGVRIFGPGATAAQDFEPEYIAVSADSRYAWVTLQENNAVALLDVRRAKIRKIIPLGLKDYTKNRNAFDASNRDDAIDIAPSELPLLGMYQPDAIATMRFNRRTFFITANEGDARDYDGFSEETRIADLLEDGLVDATVYPDSTLLADDAELGRLRATETVGENTNPGVIRAFGGRSFSIWGFHGRQIYDSGSELEEIIAEQLPEFHNANDGSSCEFDERSDDKGPEPEGVVTGKVDGRLYAFIGIERASGGVFVYDVTNPFKPNFVQYKSGVGPDATPDADGCIQARDVAPEGLVFIPAWDSPNRKPLLVVSSEVSGTVRIFQVNRVRK